MKLLEPIQVGDKEDLPPRARKVRFPMKANSEVLIEQGPEGDWGVIIDEELLVCFRDYDRAKQFKNCAIRFREEEFGYGDEDVLTMSIVVETDGASFP